MIEELGSSDMGGRAENDDVNEQRREIADTVVVQVAGSELKCACHVFGSPLLQRTLALCSEAQRRGLVESLFNEANMVALLTDKYGSHVAEEALSQASTFVVDDVRDDGSRGFLLNLCAQLVDKNGSRLLEVTSSTCSCGSTTKWTII